MSLHSIIQNLKKYFIYCRLKGKKPLKVWIRSLKRNCLWMHMERTKPALCWKQQEGTIKEGLDHMFSACIINRAWLWQKLSIVIKGVQNWASAKLPKECVRSAFLCSQELHKDKLPYSYADKILKKSTAWNLFSYLLNNSLCMFGLWAHRDRSYKVPVSVKSARIVQV